MLKRSNGAKEEQADKKTYLGLKSTIKGVIWIVASRLEPFSKIRHAPMGSSVENLDSKKPPRRLALEDYVSLFFITYL